MIIREDFKFLEDFKEMSNLQHCDWNNSKPGPISER